MSHTTRVFLLVAVAAAVFLMADSRPTVAANGQSQPLTMSLEGNYRVSYDCVFMDKAEKKAQEEQVRRIEFHPEYIVLFGQTGSGRVIPVHAIKELTWEQS